MRRRAAPSADRDRRSESTGQTIVEFAVASMVFLLIVLGTIDFGRAIFINSTLHNAVREGARVGKVNPTDATAIRDAVVNYAPSLGLSSSAVSVQCSGSCATGDAVTVGAFLNFNPVATGLLNVSGFTLSATARSEIE
jgi:Flp pilus assembly protein TadG